MVGVGGSDPMDFHALEAMQCMLERRRNGETGVRAVQLIQGPEVWKAGRDGRWSRRLLEAALSRTTSRLGKPRSTAARRISPTPASWKSWSRNPRRT